MGILKKLFGGLFSFFGILFGGLLDFITGPFRSAPNPDQAAGTASQPPTAGVDTASGTVAVTVSAPGSQPKPTQPKVVVEKPFIPNEIPAPRPNRRPGPALDIFRSMVQEIPSARA